MERVRDHWNNKAGFYGWGVVAATVVALDVALPQTLSTAADRMLEHENRAIRAIPWVIGGIVAGHVLNVIPEEYDVIQIAGDYVTDKYNLMEGK